MGHGDFDLLMIPLVRRLSEDFLRDLLRDALGKRAIETALDCSDLDEIEKNLVEAASQGYGQPDTALFFELIDFVHVAVPDRKIASC